MGPIARRMWLRSGFLPSGTLGTTGRVEDTGLDGPSDDDVYSGPATVDGRAVQVLLAGHLDPIDGKYHWRGTVLEPLTAGGANQVSITIGERTASAKVTERSQQGGYSVAGVGTPPFPR